jgi:polyphenol oxidase
MMPPEQREVVRDFAAFGIHAFTTTRSAGTYGSMSDEPARDVMGRWDALRSSLRERGVRRLATASQVHGARVIAHESGWEGWLRGDAADGHFASARGMAMAVTVADCAPVFIAHPSGACAVLHSGWRGTAARIVEQGIAEFVRRGLHAGDLGIHLGPAICGKCYQVSPEVVHALTGRVVPGPERVDIRSIIASHAHDAGVANVTVAASCTRCDNDRFFSHRAGDAGRQLGVIVALP